MDKTAVEVFKTDWIFDSVALDDATKQVLPTLGKRFGFCIGSGIALRWERTNASLLDVRFDGAALDVRAPHRPAFLRAITLCMMHGGAPFAVQEPIRFDDMGLMFDQSRNGVLTVARTKDFLMQLAMMGLNIYLPYMEDVYEIPDVPDFGYMRGRYSQAELREIDDFADALGIEVIPCIQTLGHLNQFTMMGLGNALCDTGSVLLVGDERVNRLIDRMFASLSSCLRSKRIHIGMDEAYDLGRGKYLDKHGYVPPADIMKQHLETVHALAEKHGYTCLMWDDMFFHPTGKVGDMASLKPADVVPVYWDYAHTEVAEYEGRMERRMAVNSEVWFAGSCWRSTGAIPHHSITRISAHAALTACLNKGIRHVLLTAWGDNGNDCPADACFLGASIYASVGYGYAPDDEDAWQTLLEAVTGLPVDSYMAFETLDLYAQEAPETVATPYRYALYSDPLCGNYDEHLRYLAQFDPTGVYETMEAKFRKGCIDYAGTYHERTFRFYAELARVVRLKWNLGFLLCDAFRAGDRDAVRRLRDAQIEPLIPAVEALRLATLDKWRLDFKLNGQEVQDIRLGGLQSRLRTASLLIDEYLDGNAEAEQSLACLLEPRKMLWKNPVPRVWAYSPIATAGKI